MSMNCKYEHIEDYISCNLGEYKLETNKLMIMGEVDFIVLSLNSKRLFYTIY